MKYISNSLVGIGLLAASVSVSASAIIDSNSGLTNPGTLLSFDEVPLATNASVTNQYSAYGVSFSGLYFDSSCCINSWNPGGSAPYLGNVTSSVYNYSDWQINFDQNQSEAAFTMAANPGTHVLSAYLDGSLVETLNINGSSWGYYGFTDIVFDELRMDVSAAMIFDNLQYTAIDVPEPASVALMGLGLLGLGLSRRKKNRL